MAVMTYNAKCVAVFVLIAFSLAFFVKFYVDSETARTLINVMDIRRNDNANVEMSVSGKSYGSILFNTRHFIDQRNNISRMLNSKQQKIGQMDCQVIVDLFGKLENFK